MPRYIDAEQIPFIDSGEEKIAYKDVVDRIPAADVEEARHGKWIDQTKFGRTETVCSICGEAKVSKWFGSDGNTYRIGGAIANFCPVCEAKMDE